MSSRETRTHTTTVRLTVSAEPARPKRLPWPLLALGGGILAALLGWFLVVGATTIGWLASPTVGLTDAIRIGTQFWLLANGGAVSAAGTYLSVVPLGLTIILMILVSGAVSYVVQHLAEPEGLTGEKQIWQSVGMLIIAYVGCVLTADLCVSAQFMLGREIIGAILICGIPGIWIVLRHTDNELLLRIPAWIRVVPKAVGVALLVLLIGAAVTLAIALLQRKSLIIDLHNALNPGIAGGVLLLVVQLCYIPNFLAWSISWILGAGFSIGQGTIISPSQVEIGLVPGLPIFGALPQSGPGSWGMLSWLLVGVLAGIVSAVMVVWSRPRARADETALVGGLSGVLAGGIVVTVLALSNGGFGSHRLSLIGARIPELLVLAPTLLGISGLVAGLVIGLIRIPKNSTPDPQQEQTTKIIRSGPEEEETELLN